MLILKYISAKVVEATGVTPWDMVLYVLDENLFVLKNFQVLLGSFLYYNIQSKGNTKQRKYKAKASNGPENNSIFSK